MMPPKKIASFGKLDYCIGNKQRRRNAGGMRVRMGQTCGISVGYLKNLLDRADKSLDRADNYSSQQSFYRQRLQAHGAFYFLFFFFKELFL